LRLESGQAAGLRPMLRCVRRCSNRPSRASTRAALSPAPRPTPIATFAYGSFDDSRTCSGLQLPRCRRRLQLQLERDIKARTARPWRSPRARRVLRRRRALVTRVARIPTTRHCEAARRSQAAASPPPPPPPSAAPALRARSVRDPRPSMSACHGRGWGELLRRHHGVTRKQYDEFFGDQPDDASLPRPARGTPASARSAARTDDRPVTYVDWCDAYGFCAWSGQAPLRQDRRWSGRSCRPARREPVVQRVAQSAGLRKYPYATRW